MTTRRLFPIILPLSLAIFVLQTMDARERWRASRAVAQVEHATNELRATGRKLPKHLVEQHLRLLGQAAQSDPLLVDVGINRGIQYLLSGRPESAGREFEAVLELEARAEIYANLGVTYLMTDQRQQAKAAFERAVALDSDLAQRVNALLPPISDATIDEKAVDPPADIFADDFEAGTMAAWTSCPEC